MTLNTSIVDETIFDHLPAICNEGNPKLFQNASDEEIGPWLRTDLDRFIVLTLFPIILTFGVATNSLFLVALLRIKQMRTVTNYYLAHLACCDLAFIFLLSGETLYDHAYSPIKYILYRTREACTFVTFLQHVTYYASINLVALVSFERFMAICYPIYHRLVSGMNKTKYFTIAAWTVATILGAVSAPLFGTMREYCVLWPFPLIIHRCESVHPLFQGFTRGLRLCYFLLAVVASTYMYFRIIARLNSRVHPGNGDSSNDSNQQKKKSSNRIAAMLIANGVVFFMCLAPYRIVEVYILLLIRGKVGHLHWIDPLAAVGLWTWCVNSTVNPVIYGLTNPRYRKSFWKVIKCSSKAEIDMSISQATQSVMLQSQANG